MVQKKDQGGADSRPPPVKKSLILPWTFVWCSSCATTTTTTTTTTHLQIRWAKHFLHLKYFELIDQTAKLYSHATHSLSTLYMSSQIGKIYNFCSVFNCVKDCNHWDFAFVFRKLANCTSQLDLTIWLLTYLSGKACQTKEMCNDHKPYFSNLLYISIA